MYAVIRAGGKQYKVAKGDVIEVERLTGSSGEVSFVPLLVVDDKGKTRTGKSALAGMRVTAKVVGETKGEKVDIFKYRSKTGYRRHTGHRQRYTQVEISDIKLTAGRSKKAKEQEETSDGT
ncbi:MAG: 50S ribosomal protein L21 [Actinomycetota bacterium]